MRGLLFITGLLAAASAVAANPYQLEPRKVAPDTYVFLGAQEHFSFDNHGNIVNTGFIVTNEGVVVIDTGPSKLYGEAMRAAIAEVTAQPVVQVYITHHHPDHYLGNQAFDDVPIAALAGTIAKIKVNGEDLATNLYNLVGGAMAGTRSVAPTHIVEPGSRARFGQHELELIAGAGHTGSDLAVLDHTSGVLFAGDLAFHDRAATTPNARLSLWQDTIDALASREFAVLVPGHGPVADSAAPLQQTAAYLDWLEQTLRDAAANGLTMTEVMFRPLPDRWRELAVEPEEFRRSVAHLYPEIVRSTLEKLD